MRSIIFEEASLKVEENTTKFVPATGGSITLDFLSNVECTVVIPDEAQNWIYVIPTTRTLEKQTITLHLESNRSYYRSARITVQSLDSTMKLEYQVEQHGDLAVEVNPDDMPNNEIWYITDVGNKISLNNDTDFGAEVIAHTYDKGKCIITFNAPVTKIGKHAFTARHNLKSMFLPDKITTIEEGAYWSCSGLEKIVLPNNLENVDVFAFIDCPNLTEFVGACVSEDGKCVIINNILYAFAPKGIKNYEFPSGITSINELACYRSEELESISFAEGLENIGDEAFSYCNNLEIITLPQSLKSIGIYAFAHCSSLKGFYGNEHFHTNDNKCLLSYSNLTNKGPWLANFAGPDITEYTIPDRIKAIENYAFYNLQDLRTITLNETLEVISLVYDNFQIEAI